MGETVLKVTNDLTFHNGVLVPVGTPIAIDTARVNLTPENSPNLSDPGDASTIVNVPVAVAPIGPTGPFPTMPQQVPPGVYQTTAGYVAPGGALLVAEGSMAAAEAARDGEGIEEDAPVRRQAAERTGDATQATGGPSPRDLTGDGGDNGGLSDAERAELVELRRQRDAGAFAPPPEADALVPAPEGRGEDGAPADGFKPDDVIAGTVPEVTARLGGLSRDQLLLVKDAEEDREVPRSGVHHAINAALAKLDAPAEEA